MWEEGSFSNNKGEIGADGYTITGHLQAGMFVYLKADSLSTSSLFSPTPTPLAHNRLVIDNFFEKSCCLHQCVRAFQNNKFFRKIDGGGGERQLK